MERDPRALLWDVCEAARLVAVFVADADLDRFESDPMLRSAVERQLEITGEALGQLVKVSPELAAQLPEHRLAINFRNLLIHGYAVVNRERVWNIALNDLPRLAEAVRALADRLDQA